jgi:ribosomal protein L2
MKHLGGITTAFIIMTFVYTILQKIMKTERTGLAAFTEELRHNPTLQAAVADIDVKEGGNHVGLVNVARTFGHNITVEEIADYKLGMANRLKNAQYLGTLLG